MDIHAHVPKIGKTAAHWLVEGVFIVASVALGFAVAQFREHRENRALAERALKSIEAEVEHNRATLEPFIPIHRAWRRALEHVDASGRQERGVDIFMNARPSMPAEVKTTFPILRRAAWDAALSTGALRLIDYDLAAGLSEIYGMQDYIGKTMNERIPFSSTAFFDPATRAASVIQARTALDEIQWAEETLLGLYVQQLPAIRTAAADR